MEWIFKIPAEVAYVAVAAIGGTARYLQKYIAEGDFAWKHYMAHVFVSSFSGYMFYQFAVNIFNFPEQSVAIVAGIGGWMGVESLKTVESIIKDKFKK